jgi:hypothetical protein
MRSEPKLKSHIVQACAHQTERTPFRRFSRENGIELGIGIGILLKKQG